MTRPRAVHPVWYLLLWAPHRVTERVARLEAVGAIEAAPNLWQLWQGVLYTWARALTRPETIGLADPSRERRTTAARLLRHRPLRMPFLLGRRVNPLDHLGLGSSTAHLQRHLLGAFHPGQGAHYDLEILAAEPGALEALRDALRTVVDGTHPQAGFLRDLCVYDGYHEGLLDLVERFLAGHRDPSEHPDVTLRAFLAWCAAQPGTPAATLAAWRTGTWSLHPPAGVTS